MKYSCSIIVPSYNRDFIIFDTIDLLLPMAKENNGEIILVDQTGYDKNKIDKLIKNEPFKYIRVQKPNLPNARNIGAQVAESDILVFIDDDAIPQKDWLSNHISAYEDTTIGCVGGMFMDENAKGILSVPAKYDYNSGEYFTDFGCKTKQFTISVPGGNCSVRKDIWKEIRFDKSYKANAYFEEVDFAFRVKKQGWKILYEPNACIIHKKSSTGGCRTASSKEVYYRFRNYALFYFRFSGIRHCFSFFKREKNYAEYISRKKDDGHHIPTVAITIIGIIVGALLGIIKRTNDR